MLPRALHSRAKIYLQSGSLTLTPLLGPVRRCGNKIRKKRRVLHPQSYASTHLALPAPPRDLQKVRRNAVRTGGRVKEAHFWDLDSYFAIISCVYTKCISSTNLKKKYYIGRKKARGTEIFQTRCIELIKAGQSVFFLL